MPTNCYLNFDVHELVAYGFLFFILPCDVDNVDFINMLISSLQHRVSSRE